MFNKSIIVSLYFLFLFLSAPSSASNSLPDIGTVGAGALTIEKEKEYGWAFRLMANQALPIIHDPILNHYIEDLGQNIVGHADSVKLPFSFFLVEDSEINAAAFLGGNVKIHTGLFLYAQNESELAGVVAHEVAHITQRHLARMLEQQSYSNPASLAALAGSILLALVSPAAGMAAISTTMAVTMQSQINYTRLHEYEADRIGITTLYNAGYDPYGMANFFGKLAEKYKYASMPPQMLSTHPLPETRLAEARLRAGQFEPKRVNSNLDYQLSKARITVRYNSFTAATAINYYQSQLKNSRYQLKAAAEYGLALAYFKNKDYQKANKLAVQLLENDPNNLFYLDFITDTLLALKQTEKAVQLLTPYQQRAPKNAVLTLNLVVALQEQKNYKQAEKLLEKFIRSHPDHILAHIVAIDLYKLMKERAKEHATKANYLSLQGRFREASQEMGSALVYTKSNLDQARYSASIDYYKKQDLRLQALQ
ncbi:putative beta-barrel assembly-enhancing protease [Psychromonas marina]|uniref:Putative beta-barrel assembly-enhancing protease n=1 Tax=Psychromonas marina TaxID=88364 RepID=A0ABQ6DYN8_9GAMM|nr:M48 family metalloprotease [Psychromonas marina]GLS89983.1 putative beta-barrel assembly-enhancing protease [Psychromonas marina]